jgi:hypothetical protein
VAGLDVIARIGSGASGYVVDDGCPEKTGDLVESECDDPRVRVLRHPTNQGVGGGRRLPRGVADGAR